MKDIKQLRSATSWTYETLNTKWRTKFFGKYRNETPFGELKTEIHGKRINFIATDSKWHKMEECFNFGRSWVQLKKPFGSDPLVPITFLMNLVEQGVKIYIPENKYIVPITNPLAIMTFADTFYPEAGSGGGNVTCDGVVFGGVAFGDSTDWHTIVIDGGDSFSNNSAIDDIIEIFAGAGSNTFWRCKRGIFSFDISSLGAVTISATTFSFYGYDKKDNLSTTPNINIYSAAPANVASLVAGDFDSLGTVAYSTAITYADVSTIAYNDFVLNADPGIVAVQAAVDGAGIVKIGARNANYDVADELDPNNNDPAWADTAESQIRAYFADQANTTYDPKLEITYEVAEVTTSNFFQLF